MTDPFTSLIEEFSKKRKIKSRVTVRYDPKRRVPGRLNTQYNKKTGEIVKQEIIFNPRHFEELEKFNKRDTENYRRYTVAHEMGHVEQLEEWGAKRTAQTPTFILEDDADKRAYIMSGLDQHTVRVSIKNLEERIKRK